MGPILLIRFIPHAMLFVAGFAFAWSIRGLQVKDLEQEIVAWKQAQALAVLATEHKAKRLNKETIDAWNASSAALADYYKRNPVIRLLPSAGGNSGPVPAPAGRTDGPAENTVPDSGAPSPAFLARVSQLGEDCGETTLQLITLQRWIDNVGKE